jgi:hypothetical protein
MTDRISQFTKTVVIYVNIFLRAVGVSIFTSLP